MRFEYTGALVVPHLLPGAIESHSDWRFRMTDNNRPLRFLAWPDWTEERALGRLVALAAPLVNRPGTQLVLIRDPVNDPSEITSLESLQRAFDLRFPPQAQLDVLISDRGQPPSVLAQSCDALLTLGTEAAELIEAVGLPNLESPVQVLEVLNQKGLQIPTTGEVALSNADDHPESAPVISVIVPSRERNDKLQQLLTALTQQNLDADKFEVIICDDGSVPPIAEALSLRALPFRTNVIRQEARGPGAARNTAIRHASGAVLLFLDDDSIPGESCLSQHLTAQLQASGNTAVMGEFRLTDDNRRDSLALLIDQSSVLFPHAVLEAGRMYSTDCFRTTNCSIPKALVESVGGFDETFSVPSAEDAELGRRLKRALYTTVLYDPDISCRHDHLPNIDDLARRQQDLGWSTSYMAWRHDDYTLIVGSGSSKPTDEFWKELESNLQESVDRVEAQLSEIRDQLENEQKNTPPAQFDPGFPERVKSIGFAFFSKGLIDGHHEIQAMVQARSNAAE